MKKLKISEVVFKRVNGDQFLFLKVLPAIEKLFKSDEIKTSSNYVNKNNEGLKFYALTSRLSEFVAKFNDSENRMIVIDSYGTALFTNGRANLSMLRTVDISQGVELKVNGLVLDGEFKDWVFTLGKFLKFIYKNFVENLSAIKVSITLEV